jgi:DNA-binding IclR family transcriptional regulator
MSETARMEQTEISIHQWKVYTCLDQRKGWLSNRNIATITGVSLRNVSLHTKRLVTLGILDQAEVYPGHRFRLSPKANKRNASYFLRLQQASEIFSTIP